MKCEHCDSTKFKYRAKLPILVSVVDFADDEHPKYSYYDENITGVNSDEECWMCSKCGKAPTDEQSKRLDEVEEEQ